ncbi:MAG: hypothetical protein MZW92_10550 [Comamonadaceae bacterium]|nr:hypothetical protein [Comamonadaceae bacterium]
MGERLIKMARGITVIVLDTCEALPPAVRPQEEIPEEEPDLQAGAAGGAGEGSEASRPSRGS